MQLTFVAIRILYKSDFNFLLITSSFSCSCLQISKQTFFYLVSHTTNFWVKTHFSCSSTRRRVIFLNPRYKLLQSCLSMPLDFIKTIPPWAQIPSLLDFFSLMISRLQHFPACDIFSFFLRTSLSAHCSFEKWKNTIFFYKKTVLEKSSTTTDPLDKLFSSLKNIKERLFSSWNSCPIHLVHFLLPFSWLFSSKKKISSYPVNFPLE